MLERAAHAPLCTGVVSATKSKVEKKARKDALYKISPEMQVIVGKDTATRTEVVQAIWGHIRAHELQNPSKKKEIICDEKLKKVMGNNASIQITEIFKHMQPHFIAKKG